MKNENLKNFLYDFKTFILKEKNDNQPISVKVISIKNNNLIIDLKKPYIISINSQLEINKIGASVIKSNNKKLLLKVDNPKYFQKNQKVVISNIQQEIIIKKLQTVFDEINDNKINQSNIDTLNSIINTRNTTYNFVKYNNSNLNRNQENAVQKAISTDKFHIIKGPPGTGKTHTIIEIIKELYKQNKKILVTTHTHVALDNILEKLGELSSEDILRLGRDEKIASNNKRYTLKEQIKNSERYQKILENNEKIDNLRNYSSSEKNVFYVENKTPINLRSENRLSKFFRKIFVRDDDVNTTFSNFKSNIEYENLINELCKENKKIYEDISKELIKNAKIIATTVLSVSSYLTKDLEWDYVIMDEASQVPLYLAIIPLMKTDKFILIGDDNQLQPINNNNASYLLNKSIFNLFIEKYPDNYTFLNIQYRMNQEICKLASQLYYDNKLLTSKHVEKVKVTMNNRNVLLTDSPIDVIDISNLNFYESNVNGGCCNKFEAKLVCSLIEILLKNNIKPAEIGIITPYRKQKNYIQKSLLSKNLDIETDTIYRFQGREKDVIIISFCKSSHHTLNKFQKEFIGEKNQLNVSITRSRKKLIIIGNLSLLRQSKNINDLIKCINPMNILFLKDLIN